MKETLVLKTTHFIASKLGKITSCFILFFHLFGLDVIIFVYFICILLFTLQAQALRESQNPYNNYLTDGSRQPHLRHLNNNVQ